MGGNRLRWMEDGKHPGSKQRMLQVAFMYCRGQPPLMPLLLDQHKLSKLTKRKEQSACLKSRSSGQSEAYCWNVQLYKID